MSDFLSRLADRTLGLVPVAQPIIAPMFAPNTLNDNPQDLVQNNELQDALDNTQASPAQASPAQETQLPFSKSNLKAEVSSLETRNDQENGILKPVSKPVNSRNLPEIKHSYANIPDRNKPNEPSIEVTISEQNPRNSLENLLKAQKDVSVPQIVSDKLSTKRQNIPVVPEAQHAVTFTSINHTHMGFHSQNIVAPVLSSPTPTIQVTIGRVEVRAISPPAPVTPAQRPRTPSPTLSLDEYLKQRNGGQ